MASPCLARSTRSCLRKFGHSSLQQKFSDRSGGRDWATLCAELETRFAALVKEVDLDLKRAFGAELLRQPWMSFRAARGRNDDLEGLNGFPTFASRGDTHRSGPGSLVEAVHDGVLGQHVGTRSRAYAEVLRIALFNATGRNCAPSTATAQQCRCAVSPTRQGPNWTGSGADRRDACQ